MKNIIVFTTLLLTTASTIFSMSKSEYEKALYESASAKLEVLLQNGLNGCAPSADAYLDFFQKMALPQTYNIGTAERQLLSRLELVSSDGQISDDMREAFQKHRKN